MTIQVPTKDRINLILNHLNPSSEVFEGNPRHLSLRRPCHSQTKGDKGYKIVTAAEAVSGIPDGIVLATSGFVGCGSPEYLLHEVRKRFDATSHPCDLHLIAVATTGDRKGGGVDQLAVEGLIAKYTFGWSGNCPGLVDLIKANKMQAWNLPLGAVSHMVRDAAANRPGSLSRIGLGTFVDPREGGGKLNKRTKADLVKLVEVDGEQLLFYKTPRIQVALLRGTTADTDGNVSLEREAFYNDVLNMAIAAHGSGGLVIVQVERIVEKGSLNPRMVHLPAALVDKVVVAPRELHGQSMGSLEYSGSLSGEVRTPLSGPAMESLPMGPRKIIAHRCMLAFDRPHAIVNLGVGMPEGVAAMVNKHSRAQNPRILPLTMSTEVGVMGGIPAAGSRFGAAYNPDSVMMTSTMIDLIQGGNLDAAVLGCAEVDEAGNVNVSNFSGRHPGCGGFIDISTTAKQVIFAGTFTSGGAQVCVQEGQLQIVQEGRGPKFKKMVQEKTFAGSSCGGRDILYVTERCVFRLLETAEGPKVELIEIAPGIKLQEDVVDLMEFAPVVRNVQLMDPRCFCP